MKNREDNFLKSIGNKANNRINYSAYLVMGSIRFSVCGFLSLFVKRSINNLVWDPIWDSIKDDLSEKYI